MQIYLFSLKFICIFLLSFFISFIKYYVSMSVKRRKWKKKPTKNVYKNGLGITMMNFFCLILFFFLMAGLFVVFHFSKFSAFQCYNNIKAFQLCWSAENGSSRHSYLRIYNMYSGKKLIIRPLLGYANTLRFGLGFA